MARRKLTGFPHRRKYRVTLSCEDGMEPQYTVWAENPEHAVRKAGKKYKSSILVVNTIAEEIKA